MLALRSLWRRWTFDRPQTDGGADGLHKYMLDYYSSAADYELPEKYVGESFVQDMLFSRSYRFATGCSLPMTLEDGTAGLVFGEDAKKLPDEALQKPLIIDLHAFDYAAFEILLSE